MKALATSNVTRFACLDGIRGIAILLVMLSHLQDWIGGPFVGLGQFGVWLFFALSSFLLTMYFYDKSERIFSAREWLNYAVRRFLRIYPLFILATIGGVIAGWWGWAALKPVLLLEYPGWWAIFVEFRFYFMLPFVVLAFYGSSRVSRYGPWVLLVLAFVIHYLLVRPGWATPGYEPDKLGGVAAVAYEYIIVFVTGSFAAWFYVEHREALSRLKDSKVLDAVLAVAVLLPFMLGGSFLSAYFNLDLKPAWYHLEWAPFGVYFSAFIVGVMASNGVTRWILSSAPIRFLGLISYSLYMEMDFIFGPIAKFARGHNPQLIYLALIPTIALACVSYSLIERTSISHKPTPTEDTDIARSSAAS